MEVLTFEALGTKWNITIDSQVLDLETKNLIEKYVKDFEQRFSRFLPTSEVNQFREALPGRYKISLELRTILEHAEKLRALTHGGYNVAVGQMLELAGYDQEYSFEEKDTVKDVQLPEWSIENDELVIDGPAVFDLGGIAKGYCIDGVAQILKMAHYRYFLVEAGGDMAGTSKKDGTGFRIALEWPGQPERIFGVVELINQAVAVSDGFRRRWQNWHHIVDLHKHRPVEEVLSCVAVAPTAFWADCSTSGIFLLPTGNAFSVISEAFQSEYVVFKNDGTLRVSPHWSGELF